MKKMKKIVLMLVLSVCLLQNGCIAIAAGLIAGSIAGHAANNNAAAIQRRQIELERIELERQRLWLERNADSE